MADIQTTILSKYGIDIAQENILKLYKVETSDLSDQELQKLIEDTRRRWNQSINGANEKNAERDRARLEKADKYEAILRDAHLRSKLFAFYSGGGPSRQHSGDPSSTDGTLEFAREYFKLIEITKKIKKPDVEFFFEYYKNQRKNKKAIIEMLEKEFKVLGIAKGKGKEAESETEEKDTDKEGKKKNEASPLIVNLFQEATILKLRNCLNLYEEVRQESELCQKYPLLRDSLFDFLELKNIDAIQQFSEMAVAKGKEFYSIRQEKGADYIPLVDLFNTLQTLSEYQDVVDNFPEFKLLIKYPSLTPYMYSFVEMKPAALKGLMDIANREYAFRDDTDFILNYYNLVHDNFGITDTAISSIIKKAEKKAKQNKILNEIDEKLGRKKKKKLPLSAEVIHWLVYWPIFAVYFVFETAKAVFTTLHLLTIPIFLLVFIGSNWLFPILFKVENLLVFRHIFSKEKWYLFLDDFLGGNINNGFEAFLLSLIVLIFMLAIYVLPAFAISYFVSNFCEDFNKRFDWVGLERTFQNILQNLRERTEKEFLHQKNYFFKSKTPKIFINLACTVLLVAVLILVPPAVGGLFSQKAESAGRASDSWTEADFLEDDIEADGRSDADVLVEETKVSEEEMAANEVIMVIKGGTSNLRSGPGIDYDILQTAEPGETFAATGNQKIAANGRTWYEVYLDDEKTETGWASETVIGFQN